MYLVGAPHPNKDAARDVLEHVIARRERMVSSAEVLQEILHRAHDVLRGRQGASSRDALHVAVMQRRGAERIMSFDRGFDAFATIERVY